MSKATVLTLVSDLTMGQADAGQASDFYDRVVEDLARYPWLTNASLVAITAETSQYTLSTSQIKLLAVFWDNRQLGMLSLAQVESLNRAWRDERGEPIAYVVEDEAHRTFRLYPNPTTSSKSFIFVNGQPLGLDFPAYAVLVFHTETRQDLPAWLELPVALEVAAREMERESNHRHLDFAQTAHQLASVLFSMVAPS